MKCNMTKRNPHTTSYNNQNASNAAWLDQAPRFRAVPSGVVQAYLPSPSALVCASAMPQVEGKRDAFDGIGLDGLCGVEKPPDLQRF